MPLKTRSSFRHGLLLASLILAAIGNSAAATDTVAIESWPANVSFPKIREVQYSVSIADGVPSDERRVVGITFLDETGRQRLCSGLYIDAFHVLTAKHCTCHKNSYAVTNDNDVLDPKSVWTGARLELGNQGGVPCGKLADFKIAEGNDIALLTLDQPLSDGGKTARTCSAYSLLQNVHLFDLWRRWRLAVATISGFGRDPVNGGRQTIRRRAEVKINSPDCRVAAARALGCVPYREMILGLSLSPSDRTDSCIGDSGGTAYLNYQGAMVPIGIVSRGVRGASRLCGSGGVYTMLGRADITAWLNRRLQPSANPTCGYGGGPGTKL